MERLRTACQGLEIELSDLQVTQFRTFYEMLIEKNKVMNLTAITDINDVIDKHFVDSLSLVKGIDLDQDYRILDMGTGAGFPGIPLKIVFPKLNIVMVDSLNKRIKFINEVIEHLEMKGVSAIHGRAEDFAKQEKYREQYDLCISRAVANLSTLSEYCMPYVKVGGYFIPYKSGNIAAELTDSQRAVHLLGGDIEDISTFMLPETDIERTLIMIRKINKTPKKYPRKAGLPSKEPLN